MGRLYDELKKQNKAGVSQPFGIFGNTEENITPNQELIDEALNVGQNADIFTKEDWDAYAKYSTFLSSQKSQEDLDKSRAENQSGLEQFARFLGQSVVNESILGTIRGLSDLVDVGINAVRAGVAAASGNLDNFKNDYTNPISKFLTDQQDKLRERWAIYQKDPNKSWAINDFGWWMNNATSVFSSLALLIPSTGVIKGLSYLAKLAKGLRTAETVLGGGSRLARANRYAKSLNPTSFGQKAEIFGNALLSRTMENYQEGREVYNEIYNSTLETLKNMPDVQRNYFLQQNPEFEGKTDEEIAESLASKGGTNTFFSDYSLLMFDVLQLKSLNNFWKFAKRPTSSAIRETQRQAIRGLAGETIEDAGKLSMGAKFKDWTKYSLTHPLESPAIAQLSEGVEEGYQGISAERQKDIANTIINGGNERSIGSYLTDSHIWEQAFWGWIGGMAFQGMGSGVGKAYRAIKAKTNKDNMTSSEYNLLLTSEENIRINEINNRAVRSKNYIDIMDAINKGINPYREDGNFTSYEEKENAKRRATNEFVIALTLDAVDAGNYDLLREYVSDSNFDKGFIEAGIDTSISKLFLSKMDEIANNYQKALKNVQDNVNVRYADVARLAARSIVRSQNAIDRNNDIIYDLENILDNDPHYLNLTEQEEEVIKLDTARALLKQLAIEENNINRIYNQGINAKDSKNNSTIITKAGKEERINSINERRKSVFKYIRNNTVAGTVEQIEDELSNLEGVDVNKVLTTFENFARQYVDNYNNTKTSNINQSTINNYSDWVATTILRDYELSTVPKTKEDYIKVYNEIENSLEGIVNYELDKAANNVLSYINSQSDLNAAINNIIREENIDNNLKEDLHLLKIGSGSSARYTKMILDTITNKHKERLEEQVRPTNITDNGEQVRSSERNNVERNVDNIPSTGVQAQATSTPSAPATPTSESAPDIPTAEEIARGVQESQLETGQVPDGMEEITIHNEDGTVTTGYVPIETYAVEVPEDAIDKILEEQSEFFERRSVLDSYNIDLDIIGQQFNGMLKNINTRDRVKTALAKGVESKEFNDLLNELMDFVINLTGCSKEEAFDSVKLALKLRIEQINLFNKFDEEKTKKDALKLITELTTKTSVDFDLDGNPSAVEPINDSQYINKAFDFIQSIYNNSLIADKDGIYHIDALGLFNDIVRYFKENNIDIEDARVIYYYIRKYLTQNNTNGKFGNIQFTNFERFKNNPTQFFNLLNEVYTTTETIDSHYHVTASSRFQGRRATTDEDYNKLVRKMTQEALGQQVQITYGYNNRQGLITYYSPRHGKVELGYIPFVEKSSDNRRIRLIERPTTDEDSLRGKLWMAVEIDGDNVRLNIDDIIFPIIDGETADAERAYQLLRKAFIASRGAGSTLTAEERKEFYNLPIIQKLINPNNEYYVEVPRTIKKKVNGTDVKVTRTDEQMAVYIINSLIPSIFYNEKAAIENDRDTLFMSYVDFRNKVKQNYINTDRIQSLLAESGKNSTITTTMRSTGNMELYQSPDERSIDTLGLNANNNPLILVDENGNMVGETGSISYVNKARFSPHTMGMLLEDIDGTPFIATFSSANTVADGNKELFDAISKEVRTAFENYYNAEPEQIDEAWENLKKVLIAYNYGPDNLFSGYKVYIDNDRETITLCNENNSKLHNLVLYKYSGLTYDKDAKKYKNSDGNIVNLTSEVANIYKSKTTIYKSNGQGKTQVFNGGFKILLDLFMEDFKDNLKFNRTYFSIKNKDNPNANSTSHFYKQDGKLVIEVGNYKATYDNFADLILKNKAFNTHQEKRNGSFFNVGDITNSLFLDVNVMKTPKDVGQDITTIIENNPTHIKVSDLMFAAGYPATAINIFENIPDFIPETIQYDAKSKMKADAYTSKDDNTIRITPQGLTYLRSNPEELERILIHESIHRKIRENKYFAGTLGTSRMNGIIETLRQSMEAVLNDNSDNPYINDIKDFFDRFVAAHKSRFDSNERKDKIFLAEEWLAEVLSQSALMNYLNTISYNESNIALISEGQQKKSIFSKIVDFLIEIFGGKTNEGTILDQIQRLTRLDKKTKVTTERKSKEKTEQTNQAVEDPGTSPVEGTSNPIQLTLFDNTSEEPNTVPQDSNNPNDRTNETIETVNDIYDYDDDTDYDSIDDDMSSAVRGIRDSTDIFNDTNNTDNPVGMLRADNMSEFIQGFEVKDRSLMQSELAENRLKYYCR